MSLGASLEDALMNDDGDQSNTTSADTGLLDTFWALADMKEDVREDAAIRLITLCRRTQEEHNGGGRSIHYCVKRLVRGLSSPHKAARLGFYAALVHLLRFFPTIVTPAEYVQLVTSQGKLASKSKRSDQMAVDGDVRSLSTHATIGLCLGYGALIRSHRLIEDSDVLKDVVSELLARCVQTETFREMCATLLVQLFDDVEESLFKSVLWPLFRTHFESGWEDCSCERLWLVLVCARKYPHVINKNYLKKVWGDKSSLVHVDFHETIAKIFMRSSSSHPRIHPVCPEVLHAIWSTSSKQCLYSFWETVTELAFGKQQRKEKIYLTFELLKLLLNDDERKAVTSADSVRHFLRPCFVHSLLQRMAHQQVILHGSTIQLANVLLSLVSRTEHADVQLEVIKCLIFPPGAFSFDHITHSSTISSMISHLKLDAIQQLIPLLKDAFLDENAASETHRSSALQLLARTVGLSPIARADAKIQVDVLRFFTLHAFFDHIGSKDTIPECGRLPTGVSAELHNKARSCLFHCISSLSARGSALSAADDKEEAASSRSRRGRRRPHLEVLHDVFIYIDLLLRSPRVVSPLLDEEIRAQTRKAIGEALRVSQEARSATDTADAESQAFQLLFAHLGIHLLYADTTAATMDALKDVHACYNKLSKRRCSLSGLKSNENEPDWILVIVDLLLSLLASSASEVGQMRCVVNDVFTLLVDPHLTVAALDHILEVLVSKKGLEDDDDDGDSDDDDDDDDELGTSTADDEDAKDSGETDESSSDEDDEEEEQDAASANGCNGNLRSAVKAALGNAADDSDRDDSDSDDVVLDDDDMMQLDETLAEAFRSAVVKRPSRPSEEDEALVHFRHRCFDLIDAVISYRPSVSLLLRLILPLVSTVESALKDKVQMSVGQKALACLRRLCRVKRFHDEQPDVVSQLPSAEDLGVVLRELVGRFRKVSDYGTSLVIAEACTFVVRCALRSDQQKEQSTADESNKSESKRLRKRKVSDDTTIEKLSSSKGSTWNVDECVEIYRQTLRDYFDNRERHTPHQMFTCLVKKYLHLGWQLADVLQTYAFQPDVRLFKRTRAVTMLSSLMSNSSLVLQVVGSDHWSTVSDDIQVKIADSLETLMTNVKPRCVAEMLHLIANVATLDRKYGRQLSTAKWGVILDVVQRLSLIKDLPKDAKRQIRRVITLLSQQNVGVKGRQAKKKRSKSIEEEKLDAPIATAAMSGRKKAKYVQED